MNFFASKLFCLINNLFEKRHRHCFLFPLHSLVRAHYTAKIAYIIRLYCNHYIGFVYLVPYHSQIEKVINISNNRHIYKLDKKQQASPAAYNPVLYIPEKIKNAHFWIILKLFINISKLYLQYSKH